MMKALKTLLKKIRYSRFPGLAGRYRYYDTVVHFSPGAFIFDLVAEEGIYEADLLRQIQVFLRPGGCYFDVGANVGFMSVPILNTHPDVQVVSFEPSPNALPYLMQTHAGCEANAKWHVVGKAVGSAPGKVAFSVSERNLGGYDGLKFTGRTGGARTVEVEMTTLDIEWEALGRPDVSVMKMDIEGAELHALRGAHALLTVCRPVILMEWYALNFTCFDISIQDLFEFTASYRYQIVATPGLYEVRTEAHLRMVMATTGNIALIPLP
jgi:FkbM family methyltransferase